MKLNQSLEGKKVKIIAYNNQVFEGIVVDYIFPEDNEPEGIAAIDIHACSQRPGQWIGFNENEIKSIEVIQ